MLPARYGTPANERRGSGLSIARADVQNESRVTGSGGEKMRGSRILVLATALLLVQIHARSAQAGASNAYTAAISGAALGGIVCSALAYGFPDSDDTNPYERQGWFVNFGGSVALPTFAGEVNSDAARHTGLPVHFSPGSAFGINGGVGYRCSRYFSTEIKAERIMGFEADTSLPGMGEIASFDLKPLTVTTDIKAYYPFGRFQPFLLAGLGMTSSAVDVTDTVGLGLPYRDGGKGVAVRTGGGVEFYATQHVVLNVGIDWVLPFGRTRELDYVSMGWGIQYRF
jgi:outer membrane protein W